MTLSVNPQDDGPEWMEIQPGVVQYRFNGCLWQFRYYDIAIGDARMSEFETLTDMLKALVNRKGFAK